MQILNILELKLNEIRGIAKSYSMASMNLMCFLDCKSVWFNEISSPTRLH